jgi:enamine deaminase RidA (YjgF/YER057c/UK114 family)
METGETAAPGDVYGQTRRCLKIIETTLVDLNASMQNVTRTRVMLKDMKSWRDVARAHGEFFNSIRPACTFIEVGGFIDPEWLVEVEADAIAP